MFAETGELTPEVMEEFNSMSSAELSGLHGDAIEIPAPSADLTDAEVNSIKNSAGGEENHTI